MAPAITDLPSFLASNSEVIPRVIHLDWCVCSVKDFKVLDSSNAYVNPGVLIDEATTANTLVTQEIIDSQGLSFTDALQKVSCFTEISSNVPLVIATLINRTDDRVRKVPRVQLRRLGRSLSVVSRSTSLWHSPIREDLSEFLERARTTL